jgi:LPS O-antigen subunit length determinant protein (WzzB/FepE family)
VFLAELARLHDARAAWRSTWAVLRAVGIGMLIELATAVLMLGTWTAGVLLT